MKFKELFKNYMENGPVGYIRNRLEGLLLLMLFLSASFLLFAFTGWTLDKKYQQIIILHSAIISISLFFLRRTTMKEMLESLGIPGDMKKNIHYTILGYASIMILAIILGIVFNFLGLKDESRVINIINDLPIPIVIFAIFLAPISEEFFFRGLLLQNTGILFSSFLFAISHLAYGSVSQVFGTFFIGIALSVLYKKSESLIPCIATHLLFNLTMIMMIKTVGSL